MENRFLFIIDTSVAMKSRQTGVDTAVTGLLKSNMKGEMHNGDTFGLWTYSENLNTEFPRQVWAEENKDQLTDTLLQYLHLAPADKRAHLEKVWPGVQQAMLNSDRLTVILIHDGSDPIKGTPFDSDINELQRQYSRQFKSSHEPFVTLLAASNHVFFDYSINFPSAITVPHTAGPLPPPVTNTPPPVVAAEPPPAPVVVTPPPEKIVPKPDPEPQKFEIPAAVRAAAAETPPPTAPPQHAVATPIVSAPIKPEPTPLPPPAPVVTNVAPATVVSDAAIPKQPMAQTNSVAPPANIAVTPQTPPSNAPSEVAVPKLSEPTPAPREAPATASTVQQVLLFVIALALLTIAVTLVIFLVRRSRGPSQPSLITQSMDRPE